MIAVVAITSVVGMTTAVAILVTGMMVVAVTLAVVSAVRGLPCDTCSGVNWFKNDIILQAHFNSK